MDVIAERTVSYRFVGDFRSLSAGLTAAGRSVNDFSGRLTGLDRQGERMRRGLTTLGDSAGKMGLVAAAGVGAVIKVAADFDKAMSAVAATGEDARGSLDALRAAAIKAGADTAFSAGEAAQGIEELAKAGVSAKDVLGGGLDGALSLAAAGALDVGKAAEISASAMNQFGLGGEDVTHIADLLSAGAGKASGSVEDLGMALNQAGLVAAQTGLSIEETTGLLAAMASSGLTGSDAGTSAKTFLQALVPASKEAAEAMKAMNFSAYDAQGNFKGLTTVAGDLKAGLSGMSQEQQAATLKTVFGADAVRAAAIVYGEGAEGIQSWIDKTDDAGFAAETAATRLDNLAGDIEALKGSLETALIGAGEDSQGPLRGLVQKSTEVVNVFNEMPGPIKTATTGLLGIVAITGGTAFFGARIVSGIAATNTALASLGVTARVTATSLATVGTAVGAIAVASVGYGSDAISLVDSFNRSRDAADATGRSVNDLAESLSASNVGKYAQDLGIDLQKLAADLAENGEKGSYVAEVMDQLTESGHGAGAMFKSYLGNVTPFYTAEADKASAASGDLRDVIEGMGSAAKGTGDQMKDLFGPTVAESVETVAAVEAVAAAEVKMSEALKDSRKAARETAQEFFGLGDSLDDSEVSLDGWIESLEKQADALANFRRNAKEAAENGLRKGLIAALQEAGPAGAMRLAELADASDAQIGRANKAWKRGQAQIAAYTDEVGGVPKATGTNVSVTGVDSAMSALQAIERFVIHPKRFTVTQTTNATLGEGAAIKKKKAAGGYISGPGSGTSDSIPARLSNGEYVMKASAVQRYGVNMFDGLNAERFAKGGRVGNVTDVTAFSDGSRNVDVPGLRGMRRGLAALERSLARSTDAVDASKDAVDRETSARDSLASEFGSLKSSIADMFNSELFQPLNDVFGSNRTTSDPISVLLGDIANSDQFSSLFAGLAARGLSGDALTAAARGGTAGLQAVGAYSDADLARYADLYAKRESARNNAGEQVAQARYAQALADQTNRLDAVSAELAYQTAQNDQLIAAVRDSKRATDEVVEATKGNGASVARGSRNRKGRG